MSSALALIDGDPLIYRVAFGEQTEIPFAPDGVHTDFEIARDNIDAMIESFVVQVQADDYVLCLSDNDHNFRKDLYDDYKGNRTERPILYYKVRDHLMEQHDGIVKPSLEADDTIGIMQTNPFYKVDYNIKITCSVDKDFGTIPGYRWNPHYGGDPEAVNEVEYVTVEEADYYHLFQTLCGDPVDNYKGCPMIGPKRATAILADDPSWPSVVATYNARGLDEEEALLQARLARILRHEDYDYKEGKPILWTP